MERYRNHWVHIYSESQFEGQIEEHDLKPTPDSPVTSEPHSKYYEENVERLTEEQANKIAKLAGGL